MAGLAGRTVFRGRRVDVGQLKQVLVFALLLGLLLELLQLLLEQSQFVGMGHELLALLGQHLAHLVQITLHRAKLVRICIASREKVK